MLPKSNSNHNSLTKAFLLFHEKFSPNSSSPVIQFAIIRQAGITVFRATQSLCEILFVLLMLKIVYPIIYPVFLEHMVRYASLVTIQAHTKRSLYVCHCIVEEDSHKTSEALFWFDDDFVEIVIYYFIIWMVGNKFSPKNI